MYRVIAYMEDLQDNRHAYHPGDIFPRAGLTVTAERLAQLATSANARGRPVIERIAEEGPKGGEKVGRRAGKSGGKGKNPAG